MDYKVCLVLGAGASVAMGYPVGAGLRTAILEHSTGKYEEFICSQREGIFPDQIEDFTKVFRASQMLSIDAFLARRQEFAEIGKRAIASILLDKENKDLLHSCEHSEHSEHSDHWYFYFFNKVAAAHDWDSLSFKDIAIVSFNYDRSFEHYMINALMNTYGRSFMAAQKKLEEMKIIHVYGVLGSCNPMDTNYFSYGNGVSQDNVSTASSRLKVIPEGRNDDEALQQARELLLHSQKIAFLGFGFDEVNLERLDSKQTCKDSILFSVINWRKIVATCYGMTDAEVLKAAKLTIDKDFSSIRLGQNENFYPTTCVQMLRETLILD